MGYGTVKTCQLLLIVNTYNRPTSQHQINFKLVKLEKLIDFWSVLVVNRNLLSQMPWMLHTDYPICMDLCNVSILNLVLCTATSLANQMSPDDQR